jgi:hypothetical protein
MADRVLELAYSAGEQQLAAQTASLESVRGRANNILAATAIFASFATGVGLINVDPSKGALLSPVAAVILLKVVIAVSGCALYVVWPVKDWVYVTSARKILERHDAGDDEVAVRRYVIGELVSGFKQNGAVLEGKLRAFRWATSLLVVEIVLLVAIVLLQQI